jgi:hypothetical protein
MQILLLVRFAQHGCPTMETDKAQSFLLLLVGGRKMLVPVGWAKRFPRAETQEREVTARLSSRANRQCENSFGALRRSSGRTDKYWISNMPHALREIVRALVAALSSLVSFENTRAWMI